MNKWSLDQTDLARELGYSPGYISLLARGERENPGRPLLERLAIVEERGPVFTQSQENIHQSTGNNELSGLAYVPIRQIPVISWCHAGDAATYEELPKSWQETLPSTCTDPHAFGLVVEGDSMQPNYQSGDILIMMPSTPPRNGCLVVAKYKTDGVVFRRYHSGAEGIVRLTAYNPIYPPHDGSVDDFHWIYPVHSTLKKEWR